MPRPRTAHDVSAAHRRLERYQVGVVAREQRGSPARPAEVHGHWDDAPAVGDFRCDVADLRRDSRRRGDEVMRRRATPDHDLTAEPEFHPLRLRGRRGARSATIKQAGRTLNHNGVTVSALQTHTLDAPGATLSYDVRGDLVTGNPPPLLMFGSPMDARGFGSLADKLRGALKPREK